MKHRTAMSRLAAMTVGGALAFGLAACQSTTTRTDSDSGETETRTTTSFGVYSPRLGDGETASSMAFPTGETRTSALLVHQVTPIEVARGQDFDFSYHITNLTNAPLQNVLVMLDSTSNLEISESSPSGQTSGDGMVWALGDFEPRETKIIELSGSAERVGIASDCISVSYNNFLCATVNVVEPALALRKTATQRALECDEIVMNYTVRNTGTGSAEGVVIEDTLPNGLAMANGSREVRIEVGTLASGEAKAYDVQVAASRTGTFRSPASAMAEGGLEAEAGATTTVVVAPELEVSADCDDRQFLGRNMTFRFTGTNAGDGESVGSVMTATIPSGTRFVRASEGGRAQGNRVVWDLGTLSGDAARDVSMTVLADAIGTYESTATLSGECADPATTSCSVEVRGIPAILLEVIDVTDPVEVGTQTVYVIRVTNQGSAPDTNVRVVATLPGEQSYVGSTGTTAARVDGRVIRFSPVGTLAVGAQAEWRVTVRADAVGDVRFRLEMTSDNLTSPVIETEATNLYE